MTRNRRQWKREAKLALKGHYGIMILGMIVTNLIQVSASYATNLFFSGSGTFTFVLSEVFSFILSLVLNIVTAGYYYMTLRRARGEEEQLGNLFYFFKNGSDRVIIASFVIVLLQFAASVPMLLFGLFENPGENAAAAQLLEWEYRFLGMFALSMVLQLIFTLPFSLTYYILADREEMSGRDAIKESVRMMRGHYGTYILMMLSFVPLLLGSLFTFYIALIWIMPYIQMTTAEFYRDLNGEFDIRITSGYNTPMCNVLPDYPRDDYNSEA